jgi:hypothetical protein
LVLVAIFDGASNFRSVREQIAGVNGTPRKVIRNPRVRKFF